MSEANAKLDEFVMGAVRDFPGVTASKLVRCAEDCGLLQVTKGPYGDYRAVDRALQRLRKRGFIEFSNKTGWRVVALPECLERTADTCGGRTRIRGTRVTAQAIVERFQAGESVCDLVRDYGRTESEVEACIRWAMGGGVD